MTALTTTTHFSFLEACITCQYIISYSMNYIDIIIILLTYIIPLIIIIIIIIAKWSCPSRISIQCISPSGVQPSHQGRVTASVSDIPGLRSTTRWSSGTNETRQVFPTIHWEILQWRAAEADISGDPQVSHGDSSSDSIEARYRRSRAFRLHGSSRWVATLYISICDYYWQYIFFSVYRCCCIIDNKMHYSFLWMI